MGPHDQNRVKEIRFTRKLKRLRRPHSGTAGGHLTNSASTSRPEFTLVLSQISRATVEWKQVTPFSGVVEPKAQKSGRRK